MSRQQAVLKKASLVQQQQSLDPMTQREIELLDSLSKKMRTPARAQTQNRCGES